MGLRDAAFLLGLGIKRNANAGTKPFTQETYARTILEIYGMGGVRPTKRSAGVAPMQVNEQELLSPDNT